MEKVIYFDIEYANPKNKSICQIGIMCEDYKTSDPFYPELDIYKTLRMDLTITVSKYTALQVQRLEKSLLFL